MAGARVCRANLPQMFFLLLHMIEPLRLLGPENLFWLQEFCLFRGKQSVNFDDSFRHRITVVVKQNRKVLLTTPD